ncbi:MAG: tetratricopeptide repeat protein, partial [Candidatus Aminicenantaceae bacterium]
MKKISIKKVIFIIFLGISLSIVGLSQKTDDPGVMLRSAIEKQEVDGDLQGAIDLYQQIIKKFSGNQAIAAQAQLRIGICHEKLGQKNIKQALAAFQKVVDNYPMQSEEVRAAKKKLSGIVKARAILAEVQQDLNFRKAWSGQGATGIGAVSPDGKLISFTDWDTGDLAVHDLESGTNRRLTDKGSWIESPEFSFFSKWSPDGKQILYNWYNREEFYELRTIGLDGGEPSVLFRDKDYEYVQPCDWTPDGRFILASFFKEFSTIRLATISVADKTIKILREFHSEYGFNSPWGFEYSPDGRYIAFEFGTSIGSNRNPDIFVMDSDGKREVKIVDHPAPDSVLDWTPDGKNILFLSERTGSKSFWSISVKDGKKTGPPYVVKQGVGDIGALGFSLDGDFFYSPSAGTVDVYEAQIDQESGKVLMPPKKKVVFYEGYNRSPAYSKDGRYLAYASN